MSTRISRKEKRTEGIWVLFRKYNISSVDVQKGRRGDPLLLIPPIVTLTLFLHCTDLATAAAAEQAAVMEEVAWPPDK